MRKHYRFGETIFRIDAPEAMREDPRFEAFSVSEGEEPNVAYQILPITPDRAARSSWPIVTEIDGDRILACMDVTLLPNITVANFLTAARSAYLLPERGSWILHASYVYHQGEAILFTAPCQTGKSTQAHFWESVRGSTTVNEDRVILYKENGVFMAGGCWATGSARITKNISAPIRAVILLGQGETNRVTRLTPSAILPRLMPQCSYNENDPRQVRTMMTLLLDLLQTTPVLGYDCINHESSVLDLEKHI